jgi:DNA-binding CsgD family transcriptional regulator
VVRDAAAGAQPCAEFGCAAHARVVWMHDVRTSLAHGSSGLPLRQWRPMGIAVERMDAVSVLGPDGIWGYKLFATASHRGYMGLQSHAPLTEGQLLQLEELSARFAQVLQDVMHGAHVLSEPAPDLPALVARAAPHFRLTGAEQSVLRELACGMPAKRIALCKNVTVNTVRSQIKSIYAKLDIHRVSQVYGRLHEVLRGS